MRVSLAKLLPVGVVLAALAALACTRVLSAQEMRGAWVTAWRDGFFTPQQADATVAAARKAGLNALFIQVRKNGDAYYSSDTEPLGSEITPGFDPLAYIIQKAHSERIEVHAWINVFRIWSSKEPPADPKHIAVRHPNWVNKDVDGNIRATEGLYLDPGIPEVREYVASLAEEIARKYDVDGIHLDYVRYPGKNWGYSEAALAQYYSASGTTKKPDPGDSRWMQWRRNQVTELVKLVRKKVLAVKPGVLISASTVSWGDCPSDWIASSPYTVVYQDWKRWMAEGLLDANCPMNYKVEKNPKNAKEFRNWLVGFKRWSSGKPTYVGISLHDNQAADVARQIEAVRKHGLEGYVLFSFNQSSRRDALVTALAEMTGKTSSGSTDSRQWANP